MSFKIRRPAFLRLPLEIRQQIYRLVLYSSAPIYSHLKCRKQHRSDTTARPELRVCILLVCRRIYREAVLVLYCQNVYHFDEADELEHFSARIGPTMSTLLARVEGRLTAFLSGNAFDATRRAMRTAPCLREVGLRITTPRGRARAGEGGLYENFLIRADQIVRKHPVLETMVLRQHVSEDGLIDSLVLVEEEYQLKSWVCMHAKCLLSGGLLALTTAGMFRQFSSKSLKTRYAIQGKETKSLSARLCERARLLALAIRSTTNRCSRKFRAELWLDGL